MIRFADKVGLEMHFVRLIYWTIYDNSGNLEVAKIERQTFKQTFEALGNDLYLLPIMLVLYAVAMHFYTAPINQLYKPVLQASLAPIALFPLFFFTNWDIMIMSFHLTVLLAYTCYYLVDNEAYTAFLAEA